MFDVEELVCELIANILGLPSREIDTDYVIESALWDSLSIIAVVSQIERSFGIEIAPEVSTELCQTNRVDDIVNLLQDAIDLGCSNEGIVSLPGSPDEEHTVRHIRRGCRQLFYVYRDRTSRMTTAPSRFLRQTEMLDRNFVAFSDVQKQGYSHGISPDISTFREFLTWQRYQRDNYYPHVDQLFGIGAASGALAAILSGYYLNLQIVWSFGLMTSQIEFFGQSNGVSGSESVFHDLSELLMSPNGATEYRLYFNEAAESTREAAERLSNCPGVRLFPQAGEGPFVLTSMAMRDELAGALLPVEPVGSSLS